MGKLAESNYLNNCSFSVLSVFYISFSIRNRLSPEYAEKVLTKESNKIKEKNKNVGLVRFELTIDGYLRTTAFTVFW